MATVTPFYDALKLQNVYIDLLNKSISNYKKTALVKRTKEYISERITQFREQWLRIEQNHIQVELLFANLVEKPSCEYFVNNTYLQVEDKYFEFMGVIRAALSKFEEQTPPPSPPLHESTHLNSSMSTQLLRLPKISLPSFSGCYESWRSFHDLFNSLVHQNPSLSNAQKLHYLKSVLSGEAEHLLRQFQITDANYEKAWSILLNRYNNNRVLVNSQLKNLFNLKQVSSESVNSIKSLMDKSNECLCELEALGVNITNWDPFLIYLIVQRLPSETHRMWETELDGASTLPSFERLKQFLEKRFRMLEAISEHKTAPQQRPYSGSHSKFLSHFASSSTTGTCPCCKKSHTISTCSKFSNLSHQQKYDIVKSNKLCFNCLSTSHSTLNCSSKFRCRKCGKNHHTLLHRNSLQGSTPNKPQHSNMSIPSPEISASNLSSAHSSPNNTEATVFLNTPALCCINQSKPISKALLATALVNVPTKAGMVTLRALVDPGSEVSFITQTAARQIKMKGSSVSMTVKGLNKTEVTQVSKRLDFVIQPTDPSTQVQIPVTALIVPSITNLLPCSRLPIEGWTHLDNLKMADHHYYLPGKIDMLLGAEVYSILIVDGIIKGPLGTPTAQNSLLGWLLVGKTESKGEETHIQTFSTQVHSVTEEDDLSSVLRLFWEVEELPNQVKQSATDIECEELYKKSVRRLPSGAYQVKIPFINNQIPELGFSKSLAFKRLSSLETKLSQNPHLSSEYTRTLQEYLDLGHMKPVDHKFFSPSFYMPHHAVIKDSTTSKVRVVFDASAKTSNGRSLNECMHSGPILQSDLYSILLRWRKFQFALSGDIEKMYRMIHLHPSDQPYHCILWRPTTSEPVKEFQMTRVTFGTTAAPYLAIRTLRQLAEDEQIRFPKAAQAITQDFYVDDAITGADSVSEAISLYKELTQLLHSGGFNLRKWSCNNNEILAAIPEDKRELKPTLTFAHDDKVKALGLIWHPTFDYFTLQHPEVSAGSFTKRQILSCVAKLFDPLGWISPYVIKAKILMQSLWLLGSSWDEILPTSIQKDWQEFHTQFPQIASLTIPRWLQTNASSKIQLHGFSDASQQAYSATVYVRIIDDQGFSQVNLLTAKSKVAPVKPMTLPRLELSGAHLLARLLNKCQRELNYTAVTTFAWTDSTIVFNWVQCSPHKLKTFVANRVSQIQELLPSVNWRFVRSKDNPADCNSRGLNISELKTSSLWWHGPSWLQTNETSWPRIPEISINNLPDMHNQNYFFGQSGQGRFVPSFQSTRSNFFSPSTGSFQSFRNAQHNGSPGSYQEQTLFIGEEGTTPQDTSSPFVPFPPYQSTRSPDYYELSPRPFGAGAASSSSFSRPQSVRPNGGSGFVPQKSAGRSNVPHQQSQFLAHFNEQTHLPGVPTEKTTTQSSRVGRPFGSGFSRNRPVGSNLNRQPTEDLYPSQQQLPFRNSRNRFQPSAERTTSTTTTSTSTSSPEKTSRYNRFGSGRSVQTSKAPTVQSVSSATTSTRSKLNKNIFQPRRPVFISREVNEPVHLKSRVFPSKITINHNGSNNDAEEDEETLQEEINETDHVQEKPVTENVKDIPVEEFEKLGLHEPVQNATIQNALNASGNGDGQPVIITSNFFLPQDNAEQQEEQQEEQPQQEQQKQETQKEEQKHQQQQDEESEGEQTSEEELSTTQRPDYEYEYEDYEEKSTTLPTPAEEIATVKEVHPDQETTATEEDKKETNSEGNNEEVTNSSETAPEGTTVEQSGSEEGSAEYEDDELLDDEEDEEGEFEEGSEEASPEEVQEQPKQDQNPEDIVGKAVVQVITTKSVVNGSTAVPQSISSTTSSGDTEYKENNKPPALEPNKNAEGSPAEDEGVNNATESYVVVASIQTSRSISGARFLPFPVVEQEEKKQTLSELERKIHEQKSIVRPTKKSSVSDPESESTENILPKEQPQETTTEISIITTTDAIPETTTEKSVTNQSISTESIIDKLDRVQSELSSGLLSGKFPILNEMPELEIPTTTTTTTTSAPRFVPNFRKYGKTTTSRPEKSRIDIESIPMDDLSGLLPPGFKPRQNSYRNRKITTTTRSTTTTTTTTTAAPKVNAENTVHKPSRNYTIGRSFKNTPLSSQDVTLAGLLPKGFKANTSVTEAPATQKNLKDLLSKIKFEDNLDKLLPKDYREKAPKATTAKPSVTVVDDISKFLPPGFKPLPLNSTEKSSPVVPIKDHNVHLPHPGLKGPSTTTKKPQIPVVPISDDLSKFLPPGFKLDPSKNDDSGPIDISKLLPKDFKAGGEEKPEDIIIKKIELKDVSSLLPSGYKENLTKEEEPASSTEKTDSGLKIVFPKGINKRPGVRLTTPKSSGADGPAPPAIVIKKGPPTRATTEFTGWPTPSTTPFSIEKLLEEQKAATIDISELLSTSTTTTTTTTTTTMEPPKPTEPGHCRSECDLAGTIKIVDGVKWKPELLDHNTDEWKNLAREVEAQLNEVYSNAPHLSKWYKKVRIDSFNKGSVLVDYFVELSNISRNVDTLEIKRLFHEALVTAPLPVVPLHETNETRDSSEREEKLVKETLLLGRFVVDPVSTDFIVIPKPLSPTVEFAEEDVLIPQWAIVVIVIGVGSLCFVVIFGVTVLVNRQKRAKKTPTPLTNDMLHELNKNHMGGIENYGVDEFYNVDDTWGDTKQPIKPKRFTNSMHGSSASNIYDSWRSQRGGDYYYDNHNYTPHKIDPYPPDAFADAHQMYTYNPRTRYHRDYDPDF